jgi:hypothetical protein
MISACVPSVLTNTAQADVDARDNILQVTLVELSARIFT